MLHYFTTIIGLAFCLVSSAISAQTVGWGTNIEEKNGVVPDIFQTDKGVFAYYNSTLVGMLPPTKVPARIYRYTEDLKFEKEFKFNANYNTSEFVTKLNNELYLITEEKSCNTCKLYAQKINSTSLELEGDAIVLESIANNNEVEEKLKMYSSSDYKKKAILGLPPMEKDSNQRFTISVFDENFKKLWGKEVELPYQAKLFKFVDCMLDKEGNFYVLGKIYVATQEEVKKGEDKSNYSFVLLVYRNGKEKPEEYDIALEGLFVNNFTINIDTQNNLLLTGFYRENSKKANKGLFFIKIDAQQKIITSRSTNAFTKELEGIEWENDISARSDKKPNVAPVYREDGSVILFVEVYLYFSHSVTYVQSDFKNNSFKDKTASSCSYVASTLLVVNISPTGTVSWMTTIDKRQLTIGNKDKGAFVSFAGVTIKDKVYVLFNVNQRPYNKKNQMWLSNPVGLFAPKTHLIAVEVNADGSMNHKVLFPDMKEKAETVAVLKSAELTKPNELILMALSKKTGLNETSTQHRLMKITFTE